MFTDTDTSRDYGWLRVALEIIEEGVAIISVVEANLGAVYLGAEVVRVTKGELGVGTRLGKLQFDGAGFAVAVLQISAPMVESARSA